MIYSRKRKNIMKKLLLLFSIIIFFHIDGMKRICPTNEIMQKNIPPAKRSRLNISQKASHLLYFLPLPIDMKNSIFDVCIKDKPKIVIATINALAWTSKSLYLKCNDPQYNDDLIEKLHSRLYCSHETITKSLRLSQSKKRLELQCALKVLCCNNYNETLGNYFDTLIEKGVNLDFIYNHKILQKNALMMSINQTDSIFSYLLEKGANINGSTAHGLTVLKFVITWPINNAFFNKIINHPLLDINKQNKHGETALLHCIINRKNRPTTNLFVKTIKTMLDKNANPELKNNYGLSPLNAAHELNNGPLNNKQTVIQLIEDAIAKKRTQQIEDPA